MKRFIIFWFSTIILAICFFIFIFNYNKTVPLIFSKEGGFYNSEFYLEFKAPENAVIYYTIDGSIPNPNNLDGTTDKVIIQRDLQEPEKFSILFNKTYLYDGNPFLINEDMYHNDDLATIQTGPRENYVPIDEIFKAVIIRAVAYVPNGKKSKVITHTYFIDDNMEEKYTLPIISLVTDKRNLFDYEEGIYVPGLIYNMNYDSNNELMDRIGNSFQKGFASEKEVNFEYYKANGDLGLVQNVGVRIDGGATRVFSQKSLRLYAREIYDDKAEINYDIFKGLSKDINDQTIISFKRLILRSSGNDWNSTMFRDALMQNLVTHTSLATQAYQPVIVFINGEYWGVHNLRERYDEYYLAEKYGLDNENIVILEGDGSLFKGKKGSEDNYLDLLEFVRNNDLSAEENYDYVQSKIDIINLIDYYIAEIYFNNTDWPHNNLKVWCEQNSDNRKKNREYYIKWRWLLYDADYGFNLYNNKRFNPTHNNLLWAVGNLQEKDVPETWQLLFSSLLENRGFREEFITRFAEHLNYTFASDRVINKIDEMADVLRPEISEHGDRWGTFDLKTWEGNVETLRNFARERVKYQRQHIIDYFDLEGMAYLELSISNNAKAFVEINNISHDYQKNKPNKHEGYYFINIPIKITLNGDTSNFKYWIDNKGKIISKDKNIILKPDKDLKLIAIFDK